MEFQPDIEELTDQIHVYFAKFYDLLTVLNGLPPAIPFGNDFPLLWYTYNLLLISSSWSVYLSVLLKLYSRLFSK